MVPTWELGGRERVQPRLDAHLLEPREYLRQRLLPFQGVDTEVMSYSN